MTTYIWQNISMTFDECFVHACFWNFAPQAPPGPQCAESIDVQGGSAAPYRRLLQEEITSVATLEDFLEAVGEGRPHIRLLADLDFPPSGLLVNATQSIVVCILS